MSSMLLPRLLACSVLLSSLGCRPTPPKPLRVAAAADLVFAFEELGANFKRQHGRHIDFTFGSTGLLSRQLQQGAPFDVFAAADVAYVEELVRRGVCFADSQQRYAIGRIVLWTRRAEAAPASLQDLVSPRFAKVAIANPAHAPYGRAAQQALQRLGLWSQLKSKLVLGENVQQTLRYAQTGNVDVAIVALSLALAPKQDGHHLAIDPSLHQPIDQALAVCKRGKDAAGGRTFAASLRSPEGRRIMQRYGFSLPNEAASTGLNLPNPRP